MSTMPNLAADLHRQNLQLAHETTLEALRAGAARLVWLVGITGFIVINGHDFLDDLAGCELRDWRLLVATTPLLLAIVSGVVAAALYAEQLGKYEVYLHTSLRHLHGAQAAKSEEESNRRLDDFIKERPEDLRRDHQAASVLVPWLNRLERLTFGALVVGFLWAPVFSLFAC